MDSTLTELPNVMKFNDFVYQRPEMAYLKEEFHNLLEEFRNAGNAERQDEIASDVNALRNNFSSMRDLASIRYTANTADPLNQAERAFFDEHNPEFEGLTNEYYKAAIQSPYRNKLEQNWGSQFFRLAEMRLKTHSPTIEGLMQEDNALSSEYVKLIASARIYFEGKERNLSDIDTFTSSLDRNLRKMAMEAKYSFFEKNAGTLDTIFSNLVKVRTVAAHKLGYKNFIQLAYDRLGRTDYDEKMIASYREKIRKLLVPLVMKFKEMQAQRLEIPKLKYYDEAFKFHSGNPKPKGDKNWIMQNASRMYNEISPETGDFINFMSETDLMDLENRKGKASGGYCTYMPDFKTPFIFSNFNGTDGDVKVLTHEAGHAFQVYNCRDFTIPEYYFPTFEAAEIHSMTMEFITYPWMHLFFGEETDKFIYLHAIGSLSFLPYGAAVDEFQHHIYANHDISSQERKKAWKSIEKKYLPHRDYDGIPFLEQGGFWQQQRHIYQRPFYYIDYTLAQVCAFQFWAKFNENHDLAWNDYMRLCKAGGSRSFLELVDIAGLASPFNNGSIEKVVTMVEAWLKGKHEKMNRL